MPEPTSCTSKKPFMEIGDENAPKLDYKLPQTNGFVINVPLRLDIPTGDFIPDPGIGQAPLTSYYDKVVTLTEENLAANIGNAYSLNTSANVLEETSPNPNWLPVGDVANAATVTLGETSSNSNLNIGGRPLADVAKSAKIGYPIVSSTLAGREYVSFIPAPVGGAKPELYIVEHYRVETFLGNYGAGETVKTFSLLPGEKTTISIKSYKQTLKTVKDSSNVLDSFNEDSSNELEKMFEEEAKDANEKAKQTVFSTMFGASATVPIQGIPVALSSVTNYSKSTQTAHKDSINVTNKSLNKQVQKSVSNRKVEVATESTQTDTESEETTITRVLENINKSRVLNFVFRQLNQELITVTYLDNVSFIFMNGYPENTRGAGLADLKNLIDDVVLVNPQQVFEGIINQLYNTHDYLGVHKPFVEKVTLQYKDLFSTPPLSITTQDVFIQKQDLETDIPNTGNFSNVSGSNITVNGVVMDITYRTLPTDSVIVDALLGQGEALDCFNLKLQDAAVIAANLENDEKQQAIDIITGLPTATEKATLYKKVFTDCCDVPQSGCGCNETQPV